MKAGGADDFGTDVLLDYRIPARMFQNGSNKPSFVTCGPGRENFALASAYSFSPPPPRVNTR
jgi:hypothetical protein